LVGGDVVDGVGCGLARVDDDGAHCDAVDVGREPQVEVGLWAGDKSACNCYGAGGVAAQGAIAQPFDGSISGCQ